VITPPALPIAPQYVVAFIAAARLGMVCTSLSPLMTPRELACQGNDASVSVLLTLTPLWQNVVSEVVEQINSLRHVLVSAPTDLIGAPGPALQEQRGAAQIRSFADQLPEHADKHADTAVSLDAVLFSALRTASTFLLIPDPRNIDHFVDEISKRTATVIAAVPALYQMLCAHAGFRALDFSALRIAVSGAAPFAREEIARLAAIIGDNKFCEVYGMTETSPVQTINPAMRFKPGCVGIPVPGTEVRIVDAETGAGPLPSGEAGEIIVAGPQLMRGYLNLPEATGKALRQIDGKTWMFTGDIGVMDEEGYVRVCDRSKDMLIVGGYKVFSVEVENRIQALHWVAMCAVVGRPDPQRPGNDVVQLYVQCTPTEQRQTDALRNELLQYSRTELSPYKVPKEIFFIDAIPLTSVGKIDKKALRA
jgi:long-chain acyl-CoA synthetase